MWVEMDVMAVLSTLNNLLKAKYGRFFSENFGDVSLDECQREL